MYVFNFIRDGLEHFTFVLTDGGGCWTFGYCRHQVDKSGSEKCFMFLSLIPYAESVFYKALDTCTKIEDLSKNGRDFLQTLYTASSSHSLGRSCSDRLGQNQFSTNAQLPLVFPQPYGTTLPSTLDNVS